ncbi:hypothetical protein [Tunicatimonas pelagia]|uniref:hypothetical protein n=1 Tax=Tunicatimonas pelagia TaxID=931531 RepID=UPI002666D5F9|nr:hypothetical protein [Tunicatimonas pelagia]WKN42072.1 hypothetical protein P0M28_23835 [Tunicatimonas pelagia]
MKKYLFVLLAFASFNGFAQKINQQDLYQTWTIDKYSDDETYYAPPKKERGDYMTLKADGTYVAVLEGERNTGSWMYNANGQYIELMYSNKEQEKLYIHWLSDKSMVGTYDTDEYRIWEVHYVSSKVAPK